jgi:hypothetical protein
MQHPNKKILATTCGEAKHPQVQNFSKKLPCRIYFDWNTTVAASRQAGN